MELDPGSEKCVCEGEVKYPSCPELMLFMNHLVMEMMEPGLCPVMGTVPLGLTWGSALFYCATLRSVELIIVLIFFGFIYSR